MHVAFTGPEHARAFDEGDLGDGSPEMYFIRGEPTEVDDGVASALTETYGRAFREVTEEELHPPEPDEHAEAVAAEQIERVESSDGDGPTLPESGELAAETPAEAKQSSRSKR